MPLALTVPAAAGGLAYLNARASVPHDVQILRCIFTGGMRVRYRQRFQQLNMFQDLEYWANSSAKANQDLLIFQGKHYTYRDMYDIVLRYGHWMRTELGIKPGQIVAMNFDNSDKFIIVWLALWSVGAKPAFLNYNLTGHALAHCVKAATASMCIVDPALAANMDEIKNDINGLAVLVLTPEVQAKAAACPATHTPKEARDGQTAPDMAILIYTSGTTGLPKPAIVSWRKVIVAATLSCILPERGRGGDVMYSVGPIDTKRSLYRMLTYSQAMPLYHSLGACFGFAATLIGGSTIAIGSKFSTKTFWNEVRECNATHILYIGEVLRYLQAAPPQIDPVTGENMDKRHNVTTMYGSGLRPDVWTKFKDRFGIGTVVEAYGATEGVGAFFNVSKNSFGAGAIGRAGWLVGLLLGRLSKHVVVDWETEKPWRDPVTGFCKESVHGEPGEMIMKLTPEDINFDFQGYYGNKGASDSKIMRDVFVKGDAYYRSGDVMRWDDNGFVYFSDRIGDTFRWKAENVSTAEVGNAMGQHPSVHEANVYGVEIPFHDGRAGCAATVFDQKAPSDELLKSLADHLNKSLPRYAVPLFLRVFEEVGSSTTGTNKFQKQGLRVAGVNPDGYDGAPSKMYWLKGNTYVPFDEAAYKQLQGGRVKL